jgi:hypothetical protein
MLEYPEDGSSVPILGHEFLIDDLKGGQAELAEQLTPAVLGFDDEALEGVDQIKVVLRRSCRPGRFFVRHNPDTVLCHARPRHGLAYLVAS